MCLSLQQVYKPSSKRAKPGSKDVENICRVCDRIPMARSAFPLKGETWKVPASVTGFLTRIIQSDLNKRSLVWSILAVFLVETTPFTSYDRIKQDIFYMHMNFLIAKNERSFYYDG